MAEAEKGPSAGPEDPKAAAGGDGAPAPGAGTSATVAGGPSNPEV